MDKYEYIVDYWYENAFENVTMLNDYGSKGWCFMQVINGFAVFRRKLEAIKKQEAKKDVDITEFEKAWTIYRRKGSKKKSLEQWNKLKKEEQEKALKHISSYVESVSDIKYQKDFERYLRDKIFNNVVYKDGKTLFDCESENMTTCDDKFVIDGQIYR